MLGQGSSRTAYDEGETALKRAKNQIGRDQNRTEAELYAKYKNNPLLNPSLEAAPDYEWLKAAKVKPFRNDQEMAAHFNVPDEQRKYWLRPMFDDMAAGKPSPEYLAKFRQQLEQLQRDMPEFDPRESSTADQWGLTPDGRIVLLDYGRIK